jgi:thioredoxin 1
VERLFLFLPGCFEVQKWAGTGRIQAQEPVTYNCLINPQHTIPELNDSALQAFVAQAQALSQPMLLVFHARWSRPARTVLPLVEELAAEYDKLVRFALVDAAGAPEALDRFGILTLPSFIFLRGQRVTDRITGVHGRDMLEERLELNLRRLS